MTDGKNKIGKQSVTALQMTSSVSFKNKNRVLDSMAWWPTHPHKIHLQKALVARRHFFRPRPHRTYRPNPLAVGR